MYFMSILDGKKILITGGTGSFGNAFIDFAQEYDTKFIVFSRDEKKQHDMYVERMNDNIDYVVGDIRDRSKLLKCLKDVDYILHAAALKHVPTGENFPEEVIKTNILGTKNVIEAAEECGVEKMVNLSTDKAVYPINAYGMAKALAEKLISAHKGNTTCISLRYGNVLGSRGSVIPLFLSQIENNKPITITNYDMTRFLLPLNNAVSLALKCLEVGDKGDLFVIKPPACSVRTLVDALELHFHKHLEQKLIGVRPGEKMDETLLTTEEMSRSSTIKQNGIIYAKISRLDANIGDYFYKGDEFKSLEPFTSANTIQYDAEKVLYTIHQAGLL
jgi:UDP-N-acetylglucosamine 4,6-dehydratase